MISVRRGPFRDVFLLFSGLLVGAGIVLYYPDTTSIGSEASITVRHVKAVGVAITIQRFNVSLLQSFFQRDYVTNTQ